MGVAPTLPPTRWQGKGAPWPGGRALIMLWWAFALSAVLFTALAVLLAIAVDDADRTVVVLGAVVGVLASVVQWAC